MAENQLIDSRDIDLHDQDPSENMSCKHFKERAALHLRREEKETATSSAGMGSVTRNGQQRASTI